MIYAAVQPELATIANALLLLGPLAAWIFIFIRNPARIRWHAGAFLGCVWLFVAALIVDQLCVATGMIHFTETAGLMYGAPVGFVLGQAILMGPLAFYTISFFNVRLVLLAGLLTLCAIYSALFGVTGSLLSASAVFGIGMVPAICLFRWTACDTHLYGRSALQAMLWAVVLLWLFPSIVFQQTGHGWGPLLERPLPVACPYLLPLALPAALLIGALRQFAVEGRGTGFPYDPPRYLVTHGVYAYVSNPMQLGICLMMGWWGVVIASWQVSASALLAFFLFVVFKDICNGSCAIGATDPNWMVYQLEVPKWVPRRRAWSR